MAINKNNYELYFMDYMDGKLNADQVTELLAFLSIHPDKKEELESLEKMTVSLDNKIFSGKSALKKSINDVDEINESNFDEFCIAKLEGDLTISKIKEYQHYIQNHTEKKGSERLYQMTFLKPDQQIQFPYKSKLKKFSTRIFYRRMMIYSSSVAAVGLLVFGILQFFNGSRETDKPIEISREETIQIPQYQDKIQPKKGEIEKTSGAKGRNSHSVLLHAQSEEEFITESEKELSDDKNLRITEPDLQKMAAISPSFPQTVSSYNIKTGEHSKKHHSVKEKASGYLTLPQLAMTTINRKIDVIPADSIMEKTIPDLAENGLQKLYAVLEKEVQIEKSVNDDGQTRSFSFSTRYFGFYTTKTKK